MIKLCMETAIEAILGVLLHKNIKISSTNVSIQQSTHQLLTMIVDNKIITLSILNGNYSVIQF